MAKRRYSDDDKASALATLDLNGGNLSETSRITGVPLMTLKDWRDGAAVTGQVTDIRNHKKGEIAERLDEYAHQLLDALPGMIPGANLRDATVSLGVAIDKAQLLKGQPTAITQTNADPDAARRELRDFVNSRLAGVDRQRDGRGDTDAVSARPGDDRGGVPAVH